MQLGASLADVLPQTHFKKFLSKLQGIQMAIVGANQWKGGYQQYPHAGQKGSSFEPAAMKPDSYLGNHITL